MMHRSGTLKVLQDIEEAIRREQSPGELLAMLEKLLVVAESTEDYSLIGIDRINQMAAYLAEIRYLLTEIGSRSARHGVAVAARVMAMRYRDLEGRVKEIRNDCVVNGKRTAIG